jgi:predicted  nucleic acid-binding Zn-ribbon protein
LQEKLDDAAKELAKLESKGKDLLSRKESLEKDIVSYNEKIKQAEKDIQENVKDQTDNKSKTEAQSKVVEDLKSAITNLK